MTRTFPSALWSSGFAWASAPTFLCSDSPSSVLAPPQEVSDLMWAANQWSCPRARRVSIRVFDWKIAH